MTPRALRCATLLAAFVLLSVSTADAQARGKSWEAAAGVAWFGGIGLGESVATLERPGGGTFELFRTETSQDQGLGVAASVSFYPAPRLAVEAGFSYARPAVSTLVTADAESAAAVTSTVGLQQYLVEGSARWYFGRAFGKFRPFARAGGGWMRQLDEHSAHVENGAAFHAGAGVDRAFVERSAGKVKRIGLRIDARVMGRTGGIDVGDKVRTGVTAGALVFFGF
ncbi:MAG: hypothetical protein M3Q55_14190 [Acidobacteriota bacterium]|nr:hypothetical protein [Acidobacteriota bacterium]